MAEVEGPDLMMHTLMGSTSLIFICYHIYSVDGGRSLVPRRKDWFKCLLLWMLVMGNVFFLIWSGTWAYAKYQLGYIRMTGKWSARPWPSMLFPSPYDQFNTPLTVMLNLCYTCTASLNGQEGLYWMYLIGATRSPQSAKPFLKSAYFYAWIVLTLIAASTQLVVPWINYSGDLAQQLSKELFVASILEFIVLFGSTIVVLKFPKFLAEVRESGVSREVQVRLYTYHTFNKMRTVLRYAFTLALLTLGADGMQINPIVNLNPISGSMLGTIAVFSLTAVMAISVILYLPRSSPSDAQTKVMLGVMPAQSEHGISGVQLMTLLREGGHWEGLDEDLRDGRVIHDAPFADAGARAGSWTLGAEEKGNGYSQLGVPSMIGNFTSPIAVSAEAQPQRPVEIPIQVEQEIHKD